MQGLSGRSLFTLKERTILWDGPKDLRHILVAAWSTRRLSTGRHSMLKSKVPVANAALVFSLLLAAFFSSVGRAQSRITRPIDESQRITLRGSTHPLAQAQYDRGAVAPNFPAGRMVLLLQRSAEQESSLQTFLQSVQDPGAQQYHQYLTPQQFGQQYGPSDSDLQTIAGWLRSQGFAVAPIRGGRSTIEFSGTAAQVRTAFHTEVHRYVVNGEQHYANVSDPAIPAALGPAISGITLNNFGPHSLHQSRGHAMLDPITHRAKPLYNVPSPNTNDCLGGYCFAVTPGDFATIYDTKPLLAAGTDGAGVTIGIVGISDIDTSMVQQYRQLFLLAYSSTNLPNVIVDGPDPGMGLSDDETEAYLDVEVAGAVAPNATINYYVAANGDVSNGIGLAIGRAVEDNQVSILSVSFGQCEGFLGTVGNMYYSNLFEQAAAQGITVLVSTADTGSAACDPPFDTSGPTYAVSGLFVNGLASTPYNIAVGGTDFYYPANATLATLGAYWNLPSATNPNNNADWSSAKSYIPEKPWNISNPELDQVNLGPSLGAGGGGASSCVVSTITDPYDDFDPAGCESGYPKPAWQSGFGSDTVRDLPDVSLFASTGGNYSFTAICASSLLGQDSNDCAVPNSGPNSLAPVQVSSVGGTSVAAPSMAGIMALVVQKTQTRQGQANAILYPLSLQVPQAFHDIAVGSNSVDCQAGTRDCAGNGYLTGYNATAGYDLATGLGSIDAAVLVNNWSHVALKPTATTLSIAPTIAVHSTPLTFTVDVTGGPTSGEIALLTTKSGGGGQYSTTCAAFPCTFPYAELPGGSYNVSARYAGSGTYAPSTSATVPVTITPENSEVAIYAQYGTIGPITATSGYVTSLNGQTGLLYGGPIIFSAVPVPANYPLPASQTNIKSTPATGTITVADFGMPIGSPLVLDSTGQATFQNSTLAVGKHSLVAAYSGDASYNPSNSVSPLSTPMAFTIAQSITTLQIGPHYQGVLPGDGATMQASVTANSAGTAKPTGTVTFSVTSGAGVTTVLPPASITPYGNATVNIPASALVVGPPTISENGNNTVTAVYSGDANYLPATQETSASIYDAQAYTSINLFITPFSPVGVGEPILITANVGRNVTQSFPGFPTGTVALLDGTTTLGTFVTTPDAYGNGVVTYTTSTLSAGTHILTANYSGDTQDLPSTASITITVSGEATSPPPPPPPPALDFTIVGLPVTLAAGLSSPSATSMLTFTLTGTSASASVLSLRCAAPANAFTMSCSVPPSVTIPAGTTTITSTMILSIAGSTATLEPVRRYAPRWGRAVDGFALALVLPFGLGVRRGWRRSLLSMLSLLALTTGLSACGSGIISLALPSGSYNVTVTAALGTQSHQAIVPVTVQ
jgi:Pro-kumamolisin, activation domain/Bacterial Ig-like domain (group 3)